MLPPALHATLYELGVSVPTCRRILLVDDEPGNLEVLEALLEDDWEVSTAANGEAALALLAERGPVDLIIADQRMPGMTGVELLGEVARRYPATMRVVLTAYSDVEPMLAAANLGLVYRFLLKPYDSIEMVAIVEDALRVKSWTAALLALVTALDARHRELAQRTEELHAAREQLLAEERLTTLGRLVTDMAGDLQNRGASLSLLLGLVRQTVLDPPVLEAAEAAWAGLGALRELLQQVKDYTRATTGGPRRVRLHSRELLEGTMERFLMEDLGHCCPVIAHHDPALQVLVLDAVRVRQALLALLRNAARASLPGEPIHLSVTAGSSGQVVLEVRDQGQGMEPELLARALDPFFSGFASPGIGLGLEIARLAAKAHDGEIELISTPSQGTTARIVLPADVAGGTHAA
jgi:signal transduction histidine kinase